MTINQLDLKIIYELDKNSRTSYSEIAKRLKTSKQTVKKHVDKLLEKKVIRYFFTVINERNFDIKPLYLFVKLNKISQTEREEIYSYLMNNNKIAQMASCEGPYDLYFGVVGTSLEQINEELTKFYNQFSKHIKEKKVLFFVKTHLYTREHIIGAERSQIVNNRGFHNKTDKKIELKENDFKIIGALTANTRISAVDIARNTGMTIQTVIKKIKELEKNGIIKGYTLILNENIFLQHQLLLEFDILTEELERKLNDYLAHHPNVVFVVKFMGEYDYGINTESLNHEAHRAFITDFKKEFSNHLKRFDVLYVTETSKLNFMPHID